MLKLKNDRVVLQSDPIAGSVLNMYRRFDPTASTYQTDLDYISNSTPDTSYRVRAMITSRGFFDQTSERFFPHFLERSVREILFLARSDWDFHNDLSVAESQPSSSPLELKSFLNRTLTFGSSTSLAKTSSRR